MRDVGIINDGAVAISDGKFVGVDETARILGGFCADEMLDAGGRVICPGFVDPHTHIVYAGDRLSEFESKIKGSSYLEILLNGGGIISTVKKTRDAAPEVLFAQSRARLEKMIACGTTTCEIKTGYGLETESEIKMLSVIERLDGSHPVTIVPTFLAAHAVPPEYKENADAYVDLICGEMLQRAWRWFVASSFYRKTPFYCDVFCENGAFTVDQTKKILETARSLGFRIKAHVDQFTNLGGASVAIGMGAESIDHLDAISDDEVRQLASSETVATVIPTENFNAGKTQFANARKLIDEGCIVALTTDYNPGSAPCPSQPMAMAIACRYQKLLPAEALNAATVNAAHSIGSGDRVGSIEVGKLADVLLLDCTDHREISYEFGGNLVEKVFKAGVLIKNDRT